MVSIKTFSADKTSSMVFPNTKLSHIIGDILNPLYNGSIEPSIMEDPLPIYISIPIILDVIALFVSGIARCFICSDTFSGKEKVQSTFFSICSTR